jgi:hypothetical protein
MIGNTIGAAVSCALPVSWSCARGKGDAAVGDAEHSDVRPVPRSCRGAEGESSGLSAKGASGARRDVRSRPERAGSGCLHGNCRQLVSVCRDGAAAAPSSRGPGGAGGGTPARWRQSHCGRAAGRSAPVASRSPTAGTRSRGGATRRTSGDRHAGSRTARIVSLVQDETVLPSAGAATVQTLRRLDEALLPRRTLPLVSRRDQQRTRLSTAGCTGAHHGTVQSAQSGTAGRIDTCRRSTLRSYRG